MLLSCRPFFEASSRLRQSRWIILIAVLCYAALTHAISDGDISGLRSDARYIFYHGLTNYHRYAYPEDELRPISCKPLTRDRANPAHVEVNDVLGNYSLSLVDSLSTLAILASSPTSASDNHNALDDFQNYVSLLVQEYGDGSKSASGQGRRARGFDLDSKVQVFETTIRGVGGLLSAHLFAIGDLPIRGYHPNFTTQVDGSSGMLWNVKQDNGQPFVYNGQLLRLALDMGKRLLPAFHTPTGLPYPRVNLRHGIPFYANSPLNNDPENGQCDKSSTPNAAREITETCSAGAGSLVLEFTTLSRLTGDERFERLAKRAFWAVWERRSAVGLIGAGIDAETGQWVSPFTGIGAGIDSFFEYAFKSHVLLAGLPRDSESHSDDSSEAFLKAWQDAHAAITRHIYRGPHFQHPHYAQNDLYTGGPRLSWIDSLSAYYPGLLTLAGELEEASSTHLLYTALWTRYGALPERWNTHTGKIDAGLRWWGGRPEFIESTWYLYRATQDPWYLHVGEMALRDIKRRCFTECGWAGLQDVRTGEQTDRMESFFLGETAKYLYLLFDPSHPLNHLDAPFVFTTEGHPLIIPKSLRKAKPARRPRSSAASDDTAEATCPIPPAAIPFTISATAARPDVYHAAALARLHTMPQRHSPGSPLLDYASDHPSISLADVQSPSNFTYYPWTLPLELVPFKGLSSPMAQSQTFDLTFPALPNAALATGMLQRVDTGILVNSVSGLRFGMVMEPSRSGHGEESVYRIHALSNLALGRDEHIYLGPDVLAQVNPTDPHFTRLRDAETVDLIIDTPAAPASVSPYTSSAALSEQEVQAVNTSLVDLFAGNDFQLVREALDNDLAIGDHILDALPNNLFSNGERLAEHLDTLAEESAAMLDITNGLREAAKALRTQRMQAAAPEATSGPREDNAQRALLRYTIPAMLAIGPGAAALPLAIDDGPDPITLKTGKLPYKTIYVLDSDLCNERLAQAIVTTHSILVIRRGGCAFSDKLANIPSFAPSAVALQMVIIVSFPEHEDETGGAMNIRPLLDKVQVTPSGMERRHPIAAAMAGGGDEVWDAFVRAAANRGTDSEKGRILPQGSGLGVKRRYFFTTQGVRISNLFVR